MTEPIVVERTSPFRGEVKDRIEVPAEKRELYDLLAELGEESNVTETMSADLAVECEDLVEVRELLESVYKGDIVANGTGYGLSYVVRLQEAIEEYRDREPTRLVAVGCSASKHEDDELLPAADRYRGGYWTNKREYAEAAGQDWRIISAEHDLLDPAEPIEWYETTTEDLEGVPIDHDARLPNGEPVRTLLDLWALSVHEQLSAWIEEVAGGADPRDVEFEVLLGRSYEAPLRERAVFDRLRAPAGLEVSFPFREVEDLTGIGKQRAWMSERATELSSS